MSSHQSSHCTGRTDNEMDTGATLLFLFPFDKTGKANEREQRKNMTLVYKPRLDFWVQKSLTEHVGAVSTACVPVLEI